MKVKIIEERDRRKLEDSINEYLSRHSSLEIIDIKYTGCGTYAPYGITYYSAMIIFK